MYTVTKQEKLFQFFKEKAFLRHGDRYDYSLVKYTTCKKYVNIKCTLCGYIFSQTPDNHLQGKGCPRCSGNLPYNFQYYKNIYNKIHHNKYEYLDWYKKDDKVYLKVFCSTHKEFNVRHSHHLGGVGCKRCTFDAKRITEKDFLSRLSTIYGDKYHIKDLSNLHFRKELDIYCTEHNISFTKTVSSLLNGNGCPKCFTQSSIKEDTLYRWILKYFPDSIQTYKSSWLGRKSLDIFIPNLNLAIEYNGIYWHRFDKENPRIYKEYHQDKFKLCLQNGINLIHIFEFEDLNKWKRKLRLYFEKPDKFKITFKNNKRFVNNHILYGQSFIKI